MKDKPTRASEHEKKVDSDKSPYQIVYEESLAYSAKLKPLDARLEDAKNGIDWRDKVKTEASPSEVKTRG